MSFASEQHLLYLWLLLPLSYVFYLGHRAETKRLHRFANEHNRARLYRAAAWPRTCYVLLALVFVALVVALAQPRFGYEWVERQKTGRDIYVVLDVSRSMLAADTTPNRLQRAKRKLADLLSLLDGDRVSLIAFAGAAFVQCPLTVDYSAARLFLDHLHPSLIPVRGTAIGAALQMALQSIEKSSTSAGAAIILITDGEDQGTKPLAAAQRAQEAGVKIFAIGIGGQEGAPIPAEDGGFIKDNKGNLVMTRLDEQTLQQIALLTGGVYVRSVSGDFDLQQIYQRGIKEQVDMTEQGASRKKIWHEHFHLLLLLALLCLLLEFFLTRKRRAALALLLCLLPYRAHAADGHKLFEQKQYEEAAQQFLNQAIDDPEDLAAVYNHAVSQFRAGDYAAAAQGFAKAAQAQDPQLANRARFNLGNSHIALQQLQEAQQAYETVLKHDPDDHKAAANLKWVKEQIKKQQQQQQKNQENQQQQQQKNQENQQQQQQKNQENQQQQAQPQEKTDKQELSNLSKAEVERLLRQLESGRIGVKPQNLTPAPKSRPQEW